MRGGCIRRLIFELRLYFSPQKVSRKIQEHDWGSDEVSHGFAMSEGAPEYSQIMASLDPSLQTFLTCVAVLSCLRARGRKSSYFAICFVSHPAELQRFSRALGMRNECYVAFFG